MKAKIRITDNAGKVFESEISLTQKNKANVKTKATFKSSAKGSIFILELKPDGLFKMLGSAVEIHCELMKNAHHYPTSSLTWAQNSLVKKRELGRIKEERIGRYVEQ